MLTDLVVDTNVFVHADNPSEQRHGASVKLLDLLLESDTHLGIDEGFDLDPGRNRSLIGHEYLEKLTPMSAAFRLLAHLAQSGRMKFVSRSVDASTRRKINQMLRNKRDRTFLLVASKTDDRVLCSHDFQDFAKAKRKSVRTTIGVSIIEASDVVEAIGG